MMPKIITRAVLIIASLFLVACPRPTGETTASGAARDIKVEHGSSPFVEVASRLTPSVVNVSVERTAPVLPRINLRSPLERLFKRNPQPETPEYHTDALGSGLIIDEQGYILTNYHVVRGYDQLKVILSDNTAYAGNQVKLVGSDEKTDLAVVKVATRERLPAARLGDSDSIKVGQWAIAVGSPYALSGSVTVGVISAVGRGGLAFPEAPSYQDFIQTDAAINPGNSGGPLVNIRGEVIGINTAIQTTSGGNIGIGFAVPINAARRVAEQLMAKGKVVRGYLGVTIQEVTPEIKDALGLQGTEGVVVSDVVSGSPADKAGLKSDDIITKYNGNTITSLGRFRETMAELSPGTTIALTVLRAGKELNVEVRLATMPEQVQAQSQHPTRSTQHLSPTWLGMTVTDLSDTERRSGVLKQGVKVSNVESGSPADTAGILVGDFITAINRHAVTDAKGFAAIARSIDRSNLPVTFDILRGKTRYSITVTP